MASSVFTLPFIAGSALIGFVAPTVTVSEGADAAVLCYSIIEGTLAQAFNIPSTQLSVSTLDITATGIIKYCIDNFTYSDYIKTSSGYIILV